jgi:hypothetical protein
MRTFYFLEFTIHDSSLVGAILWCQGTILFAVVFVSFYKSFDRVVMKMHLQGQQLTIGPCHLQVLSCDFSPHHIIRHSNVRLACVLLAIDLIRGLFPGRSRCLV